MDQKVPPYSTGAAQIKEKSGAVGDLINRGRDAIAETANGAAKSAGSDLQAIRDDLKVWP
jgi:hypothetical protein